MANLANGSPINSMFDSDAFKFKIPFTFTFEAPIILVDPTVSALNGLVKVPVPFTVASVSI